MATKTLYDVVIEADEPWHAGLRQRMVNAVATFTDNKPEDMVPVGEFDADALLASYVHDYVGYGANALDDADGFVFSSLDRAQAFADHVRDHVGHEATVKVWSLDAEAEDDEE